MFNLTKKVLRRVLNDKRDNLVRLNFDYYYANKKYSALGGLKGIQGAHQQIEELRKKITTERVAKKGDKDKEKIIGWEKEILDLENKVSLLKMFGQDLGEARNALILGKAVVEELKNVIEKNPEIIYEASKDII